MRLSGKAKKKREPKGRPVGRVTVRVRVTEAEVKRRMAAALTALLAEGAAR